MKINTCYDGVEPKLRPFVARTAAIATLAQTSLGLSPISEAARGAVVYFHHLGLESGRDFLYVDLTPVIQRFSAEIAGHPLGERLVSLLVECLQEYAKHEAHPIEVFLAPWQFRVAQLCADWLAALVPCIADPLAIVNQLPHWPALRVARGVVEANRATKELVECGIAICGQHAREWSNVSPQRDSFLSALAAKGLLPPGRDLPVRGESFDASSDVAAVDARIDTEPQTIFESLHSAVNIDNAVSFLWQWSCESRSWRAVLLGHVHRACFRDHPLTPGCAQELAAMVLEAAHGLRDSPLVRQNLEVFSVLGDLARGKNSKPPQMLFAEDFLSKSQRSALALIADYLDQPVQGEDWLYRFLSAAEGWIENYGQWIEYGTPVHGSGRGRGAVYLPPALRIALAIVGDRTGLGDFGSRWIRERAEVRRVAAEAMPHDWIYQVIGERGLDEQETNDLKARLTALEAAIRKWSSHPDVWRAKGHLHLLLGHWEDARSSLVRCFEVPVRISAIERSAHYDLACVYARVGRSDECRAELTRAIDRGFHVTEPCINNRKHVLCPYAATGDGEGVGAATAASGVAPGGGAFTFSSGTHGGRRAERGIRLA